MNQILRLAALSLALATSIPSLAAAQAYPIDCAIFLCLAGGFPASPECAAAEAVFIARIESFQPPLQLWNCPMGASFRREEIAHPLVTLARLEQGSSPGVLRGPYRPLATPVTPLPAAVDFTGSDYAFIRSIHVWWTRAYATRHRDGCSGGTAIEEGYYDARNNWHWGAVATPIPGYLPKLSPDGCGMWNDVGADWTDYLGNPSHILKPISGG